MTTFEVERKYRTTHAPVRERLEPAGFTPAGTVEQTDRYFDHPARPLATTDEAVRIRAVTTAGGTRHELTYKGPRQATDAKSRRELTVAIDSGDVLALVLESLDFRPVDPVVKTRERFARDAVTVALDTVEELGEFVEIEVVTGREDLDAAEATLVSVADELKLETTDAVDRTYLGLLLDDAHE